MAAPILEVVHDGYTVSTDPERIDVDVVHRYLSEHAYWARGRARDVVARSIGNSAIVVGAYAKRGEMVGFARMVSDLATFAWLADVFVLDAHRGRGLGVAITRAAVEHPCVVDVKRQVLATADAHRLYERFGYAPLDDPGMWMARTGGGR